MKTIIIGHRSARENITNLLRLNEAVNHSDFEITEVISGGAKGWDTLAKIWSEIKNIKFTEFPAEWSNLEVGNCIIKENHLGIKYNLLAGVNRNTEMVKEAEALIAMWNGKSTGTLDTIEKARKKGLKVFIYRTDRRKQRLY